MTIDLHLEGMGLDSRRNASNRKRANGVCKCPPRIGPGEFTFHRRGDSAVPAYLRNCLLRSCHRNNTSRAGKPHMANLEMVQPQYVLCLPSRLLTMASITDVQYNGTVTRCGINEWPVSSTLRVM